MGSFSFYKKRENKDRKKIKWVWLLRMTGSAPERLMGPKTVLNWPAVARLYCPIKSQFQPGHEATERELCSRHERLDSSGIQDSRLYPHIHFKRHCAPWAVFH